MEKQSFPTSASLRTILELVRQGMDAQEHEMITSFLARASAPVAAAIPETLLVQLAQVPPSVLERYALLQEIRMASAQQAELVRRREDGGMPDVSVSEQAGDSGEGKSTAERVEQPHESIRRGQALRVALPVTSLMTLDPFQNAYHGQVEIKTGTKKRTKTESRVVAVIREVYEAERDQVGDNVEDPGYWRDKLNWMSVYLLEELEQMMEVAWILGDYDPISSRVPAGIKATPEQIAAYLSAGVDDEEWAIRVIKLHLRTPEQKAWLAAQDYSIEDVLNGRTYSEPEIQAMFDDWNAKLGVKAFGF